MSSAATENATEPAPAPTPAPTTADAKTAAPVDRKRKAPTDAAAAETIKTEGDEQPKPVFFTTVGKMFKSIIATVPDSPPKMRMSANVKRQLSDFMARFLAYAVYAGNEARMATDNKTILHDHQRGVLRGILSAECVELVLARYDTLAASEKLYHDEQKLVKKASTSENAETVGQEEVTDTVKKVNDKHVPGASFGKPLLFSVSKVTRQIRAMTVPDDKALEHIRISGSMGLLLAVTLETLTDLQIRNAIAVTLESRQKTVKSCEFMNGALANRSFRLLNAFLSADINPHEVVVLRRNTVKPEDAAAKKASVKKRKTTTEETPEAADVASSEVTA